MSEQYETPYAIDFSKVRAEASAAMDAAETPEPVVEQTPVAEAVEAAVAGDSTPTEEAAPVATPIEDLDPDTHGDRLVKVKINGEWQTIALKEVAAGYSRTSDYTRKAQEVAKQRLEVEQQQQAAQQSTQQLQYIKQLLNDKAQVQQFIQAQYPDLLQAAQQPLQGLQDPNEIATIQQARQLVEQQATSYAQQLQQLRSELEQKQKTELAQWQNNQQQAVYADTINTTLKDIFEQNPVLNKIPSAADVLRSEVLKLAPKTVEEALDAFKTVAKGIVEDLNSVYTSPTKPAPAAAKPLKQARMEPPGGTGPQITPTKFSKHSGRGIDWKALYKAAEESL